LPRVMQEVVTKKRHVRLRITDFHLGPKSLNRSLCILAQNPGPYLEKRQGSVARPGKQMDRGWRRRQSKTCESGFRVGFHHHHAVKKKS
jgi:hypothetical protein